MVARYKAGEPVSDAGPNARTSPNTVMISAAGNNTITNPAIRRPRTGLACCCVVECGPAVPDTSFFGTQKIAGSASITNPKLNHRKPVAVMNVMSHKPTGAPLAVARAVAAPKYPRALPRRSGATVDGTTAVPHTTRMPNPKPPTTLPVSTAANG